MKTKNNNQETVRSQFSKLTLHASAVLLSAVLISTSVDAQSLWEQLSNTVSYGKMTLTMDAQSSDTENADAAFEVIQSELASQLSVTSELSTTALTEEAMEVEDWMTNEAFFNEAEQYTADGADLQITKYAEILINEGEKVLKVESWMTDEAIFSEAEQYTANGADDEIAKYAKKIIESQETENTSAVESWMTDENFFNEAEQYTADGADYEIAKYAEALIGNEETENALTVENWMTHENFFNAAEQYTADGADHEIARYAEQIAKNEESEDAMTVESWMLDNENFTNQMLYVHFIVR